MDATISTLLNMDKLPLILVGLLIVACYLLYKAQTKPDSFDLRDLIVDSVTGKVSLNKFGQFVALALSSWGFIYLAVDGKLTEVYFTTYMVSWAGATVLTKALTPTPPTPPPPESPNV